MKLRSFLLAASAMTLAAAGTANALTFGVAPGVANVADDARSTSPGATTQRTLASELDFAGTPVTLDPAGGGDGYVFQVDLETGTFTSGQVVRVTVDYPTGLSFGTTVPGTAIRRGTENPTTATDADPAAVTVSSGGGADDTSVTFLYTAGPEDGQIGFAMPVQVDSCPADDAEVTVTIVLDTSGTPIEANNPISEDAGIDCAQAFEFTLVAENDPAYENIVELPDFTTIADDWLGLLEPNVNTLSKTLNVTGPSNVSTADVLGIDFDIVFEDSTGLDDVDYDGTSVVINTGAADTEPNVASFSLANGDIDFNNDTEITVDVLTGADAAPIAAQDVFARNIEVTLAAEFIGFTLPDAAMDPFIRQGQNFGPFDWNNEDGPVNSVYRVTGLSTTEDTPMTVTYTNSNAGDSFNTTTSMTISPSDLTNGEYVITSRGALSDMNAGYSRADVAFFFETNNDVDVDRLISSDGTVGNFGNTAANDD